MGAHLLVDGYNLARSGALPLSEDPASEEGRRELCELLAEYARGKGFRLTVVFDGRGAGRPERSRSAFKGGAAVFSSMRETADDVIRDMARNAPAGTVVVTSDRGLAGTLPSRSVAASCAEFAARLFDHRMESVKGASDGDEEARPRGKKGEGHRAKKRDRKRNDALRKL
ncbi:MAG: NYN domain-containing protein [Thermodesulfobacteriota bacterium]